MVPILPPGYERPTSEQAPARTSPADVHEDYHMRSVRAVTGYTIEATDGTIGHVDEFLLDDVDWHIRYLVVDTRNWWPGKKVLISPQWISEVGWSDSRVHVGLTRAGIKGSPEYDPKKPIAPEYLNQLHQHYDRPPPLH